MDADQLLPPGADREDRERWLAVRRTGIGGSDVSAILGLHPYRCARDVWEEKLGRAADREAGEPAFWGTEFEPIVRDVWTRRTGIEVEPLGIHRSRTNRFMLTSVDGLTADGGIYEGKTATMWKAKDWDDDQVADHAELQVQHNMATLGLPFAWVVVLLGGQELRWRKVWRDEEMIRDIIEAEQEFWECVQDERPPRLDGTPAAQDYITRRHPEAKKGAEIVVDEATALRIRRAYKLAKSTESKDVATLDELKNIVRELIGDAELLVDSRGQQIASWKNNGSGFDEAAFRVDHPDLVEEFTVQVPQLDRKALQKQKPDLYAKYRNRVLRIKP